MTCPPPDVISQFLDDALADGERAQVEAHLDDCFGCSELVCELAGGAEPGPPGYLVTSPPGATTLRAIDRDGFRVRLVGVGAVEIARAAVAHAGVARIREVVNHDGRTFVVTADAADVADGERARAWRQVLSIVAALHRGGHVHDGICAGALVRDGDSYGLGPPGIAVDARYRSPERTRSGVPSPVADQFALCTAMWEAIAQAPPFAAATAGALAISIRSEPRMPATASKLDRRRLRVLARGLAADPRHRFPSLDALGAALDRAEREVRLATWVVVAGAVIVAIAVVIALAM